jgi:zinc/manganese transport system substrate-binding protein
VTTRGRTSQRSRCAVALLVLAALAAPVLTACGQESAATGAAAGRQRIVVTTTLLGAVVRPLVGTTADVQVLMPNGADPHDWEPSAKDIAALRHADVIIENGLGLEGGLQHAIGQARGAGVQVLTASDDVDVRIVGQGEGTNPDDPDQAAGAKDPHLWMDPTAMAAVVRTVGAALVQRGIDVAARIEQVAGELDALDSRIAAILSVVPADRRKLVTGHESLGYFARHYHFVLIGAVVPSVSSQAEASAGSIAHLRDQIAKAGVPAIFTEIGTPGDVVKAIASETGARAVPLVTHVLPADGSYDTFLTDVAHTVADALKGT